MRRASVLLLAITILAVAADAGTARDVRRAAAGASLQPGALTQLSGTAGCVSHDGSGGLCQQFGALEGAWSVAVSDDGKNVYVAASVSDAVVVFARDAGTGALTPLPVPHGCISKTTSGGFCTKGRGLNGARDVLVTPGIAPVGGKDVYVAGYKSDAVAAFQRNPATGALTQLPGTQGCMSKTGSGGDCAKGVALNALQSLATTYGNLYVASTVSQGVAMFERNEESGYFVPLLGHKSCVSETGSSGVCDKGIALLKPVAIASSSDYTSVYVANASALTGSIAVFRVNPNRGGLVQLPGMQACVGIGYHSLCTPIIHAMIPRDVVVTPDGKYVYVASSPTSTIEATPWIDGFRRDPGNGALTHVEGSGGCIEYLPITFLLCRQGHAILGAYGLAVSPDGANVYVAARDSDAVVLLDRSSLGELTEREGTAGCISSRPAEACTPGRALDGATAVAVSPDGKNVYVASSLSNSVAVFKRQG